MTFVKVAYLKRSKKLSKHQFKIMVEVLLSGLVLGLVPVTIAGLFVAAYLQYRRGNQFGV